MEELIWPIEVTVHQPHSRERQLRVRMTEIVVAGRKNIVIIAIVFMAMLSFLVSITSFWLAFEIS
jgi:hypothetical protein